MSHTYCLYNNDDQEQLLAMAYSKEEIKEESKYFTGGTWFMYDNEGESLIVNERKYTPKVKFPKEAQTRNSTTNNVEEYKWVK